MRPYHEEDLIPRMISDVKATKLRLQELKLFIAEIMEDGLDYGKVPGIPRPFLWLPGAEKLLEVYGYAPVTTCTRMVEDWEKGFFFYEFRCDAVSKRTGKVVANAHGCCSSLESKYRYRDAQRVCPECGEEAIIKSKFEDGGWYCFPKKDGCGAKFQKGDPKIEQQDLGKVLNDDTYSLQNTILKMAEKRAVVGVAKRATRSSGLFQPSEEEENIRDVKAEDITKGRNRGKLAPPARKSQQADAPPTDAPHTLNQAFEGVVVAVEEKRDLSGTRFWGVRIGEGPTAAVVVTMDELLAEMADNARKEGTRLRIRVKGKNAIDKIEALDPRPEAAVGT
jgi:predicted RNA-binding Zn-ribbon protein involved in translation (DUF1610 family)